MKPGDRIGTYILVAPVARGGMGEVWRARHHTLSRFVAIKFIRSDVRDAPGVRVAFEHEVRNLARLHAPQTVQVIDSGVHGDHPYMVTEFLEGEDLRVRLREEAHLRPTEAVWIAIEVLKSLSEAHALGIVHRDLKPGNVFLQRLAGSGGERYAVKVLDFGIAKVLQPEGDDPDFTLWPGAAVKGSPRYMAPEQVKGQGVTPASDLYSVGALLYRALSGEPVFRGEKEAVLKAQVEREPEPLSARAPLLGVPERLDTVVLQCLAKDPARRPASADHLRETLEALLPELGETDALMELDGSVTMSGPLPAAVAAARASAAAAGPEAPLDPFAATQAFSADDVSASVNAARGLPIRQADSTPPVAAAPAPARGLLSPPGAPPSLLKPVDTPDWLESDNSLLPGEGVDPFDFDAERGQFVGGSADRAPVTEHEGPLELDLDRAPPPPAARSAAAAPRGTPDGAPPVGALDRGGPRATPAATPRPPARPVDRTQGVIATALVVMVLAVAWFARGRIVAALGVDAQGFAPAALAQLAADPSAADAAPPAPPPPPPEPLALIEGPLPDGGVDRRQQVAIQVAPVPAKFTRTDTGEVVCEEAEWCYVPIDVDVTVEHRSYQTLVLSGDDLYDRRGHHWRVILRKK